MCDIVLEKPINCSGFSWEAMWVPLCTSSSQMWLFPQCQIPRILAAEWVQNLTWSETCAYKNLLSLNSWCILGALMCKLHFEIAGWHHLWASLAHTRTDPREVWLALPPSPQIPFWLFPCFTWGRDAWVPRGASQRPAYNSCPQLTLELAESVKRHDSSAKAGPGELGSPWGQELMGQELQPSQYLSENKVGQKHQVSWPSSWHCCGLTEGYVGHQHPGSSHSHSMLHQSDRNHQCVVRCQTQSAQCSQRQS